MLNKQNLAAVVAIATRGQKTVDELQAEHAALVAEHARRNADRYATGRDDDSFVSQRAESLTESIAQQAIDLRRIGNLCVVPALYHGDRPVKATLQTGQWGTYWHVSDAEQKALGLAKPFIADTRSKRGAVAKAGCRVRYEVRPGKAVMTGNGYGFAGLYSAGAGVAEDVERTRECIRAGIAFPVVDGSTPAEAEATMVGTAAPDVAREAIDGNAKTLGLREVHDGNVAAGSTDPNPWALAMIAAYERGIAAAG